VRQSNIPERRQKMQKNTRTSRYIGARFFLLALAALLLLAACGSNSTSTGSGSTTTPTASGSGSGNNGGYGGGKYGNGGGGTTPTASSSKNLIQTATVTVNGKSETVLTNGQGLTLYYRTSDSPPSTVCSGGCASAWPPLLFTGSGTPTSASTLPGKLSVQATANGNQVEYNGHPLYNYSGDTGPGQANGEGLANVWFVVTPDLK
jgi:predicted lipoprotein with Yx(FWY)xxD motif